MPRATLNFTGNFKDLKKLGFTFQKMYASNYMCWRKTFGKYEECTIWIWKKGNEVCINDWHEATSNIVKAAVDCKNFPWERHTLDLKGCKSTWTSKELVVDRETNEVYKYDQDYHDHLGVTIRHFQKVRDQYTSISEYMDNVPEEVDQEAKAALHRYRKVTLGDADIEAINLLLDNGLIDKTPYMD